MRTLEKHMLQCVQLENDPDGEYSKEYGINCRSAFLDLDYFDLCSGALVPDVMHDLLEGALQHVLKLLLHYCIEEKRYFTLTKLNRKISGIELGYMEDNRPSLIDHWSNIRQNGNVHIYTHTCTCT